MYETTPYYKDETQVQYSHLAGWYYRANQSESGPFPSEKSALSAYYQRELNRMGREQMDLYVQLRDAKAKIVQLQDTNRVLVARTATDTIPHIARFDNSVYHKYTTSELWRCRGTEGQQVSISTWSAGDDAYDRLRDKIIRMLREMGNEVEITEGQ